MKAVWVVTLVVAGCSGSQGSRPPPAGPPPAAAPKPDVPPPSAPPPKAPPADASPTKRTPEQIARDTAREPLATALVDAYANQFAQRTRDGKRIVFVSNREGTPQIYIADAASPASPPVALTHGPQRTQLADLTRDGKSLLFMRDQDADENWRLFAIDLDGTHERNLTPGPVLHRDAPLEPRGKHGTLVYTQHDVKSPASQLVVQPLAGGEPKVVYTDPSPAYAVDVTANGTRALLIRWVSSSELVALEVDLATGKPHQLYPAEGKKAVVTDARYTADGKRVLLGGDDGAEGQYLFALDARSGKQLAAYKQQDPPTAFVEAFAVSPRGDRVAIQINAGDHSEARLLDAKTLAVTAKVAAPLGMIELGRFADDGKTVTAMVSAPDAPADVFSIDAASGKLSALRNDPRPGLEQLPKLVTSIEHVKAFDGQDLHVNLYLPADGTRPHPVIVNFHGGPSSSYQVRWNPFARFFTSLGYAYAEPNVRGSTGFGRAFEMADDREKRADWLKDLATINAWVKAAPWGSKDKVVVLGGSYGGYTVLMALTRQPALWKVGVDLFGVANLTTFLQSTDAAIRAGFVQEFGDLDKDKALIDEFSPIRDIAKVTAPLFVYAGANDPRVPRTEDDQIVKELRSRGVPVEYMVANNEGHSLDHRENRIELLTRVARFLEDHLK